MTLRISTEGAGVVVADHDDQPRAEDRQQCLELGEPTGSGGDVALQDRAQRTVDVTDMGIVKDRAAALHRNQFTDGGHCFLPHEWHSGAARFP